MIKNICYCDKCKKEIKDDGQYYKIDIFKRKWYHFPDDASDKERGIAQQKLHLCDKCMNDLSKFLKS